MVYAKLLETAIYDKSLCSLPKLVSTRAIYSGIGQKLMSIYPDFSFNRLLQLNFTATEFNYFRCGASWSFDVCGLSSLEKDRCMVALNKNVIRCLYNSIPRRHEFKNKRFSMTPIEVEKFLETVYNLFRLRKITCGDYVVFYILFRYGIRLVDLMNMRVKDFYDRGDGVFINYYSYKERSVKDERRHLVLIVPNTDDVGCYWLRQLVINRSSCYRLFHNGPGSDDDYRLPCKVYRTIYKYYYELMRDVKEKLGINVGGGTHVGRRSLFSNCLEAHVSLLSQILQIQESTARKQYRRVSVNMVSEFYRTNFKTNEKLNVGINITKKDDDLSIPEFEMLDICEDFLDYNMDNELTGICPNRSLKDVESAAVSLSETVGESRMESLGTEYSDDATQLAKELASGYFSIDRIVDSGIFYNPYKKRSKVYVRLSWLGYDDSYDTWEKLSSLGYGDGYLKSKAYIGWVENNFEPVARKSRGEKVPGKGDVLYRRLDGRGFCDICLKASIYFVCCYPQVECDNIHFGV